MSPFSASSFTRAARPLATAALLATLLAGAAEARLKVRGHLTDDSGRVVGRVNIGSRGIVVTRVGDDSLFSWQSDSLDDATIVIDDSGTGMVRLFADAHVAPGQRIEGDVVAVFGSVHVEGEVTGSTVAVFGSVDLGPNATVGADAVAVGGGLNASPGSRVAGESVAVGFLPLTLGLPALPVLLATIALGWLTSLFFGWMIAAMFPQRLERVAATVSRRTAVSFALGVLSGPMFVVACVLLLVTVVGVPIAVLLPFVYIATVFAGQLAATYVLGRKLTRQAPGTGGAMLPLAAATGLVAVCFAIGAVLWMTPGFVRWVALFFEMVGALMLLGLSTIGTGAVLLSRGGSAPRERAMPAMPGTAPPDAPAAPSGASPIPVA